MTGDDVLYLSPLSGELLRLRHPLLGCMRTPQNDRGVPDGVTWAADNGCFAQGARFDLGAFLAWLAGLDGRERCLFATAPDVVGDAEATLERSAAVLPQIRALGYRAALVGQDGLEDLVVPWDDFGALFIGGTTTWKLSEAAYGLAAEAKRRGKWVHMGRVNGEWRLRAAAAAGYDSADGTGLAINPGKNWRLVQGWLDRLDGQPSLWESAV